MPSGDPGRRTRFIVIGSLAFALIVAIVGFVLVGRAGSRLDRQTSDARLCTSAASTLELVQPNMASGPSSLAFSTSRTTARKIATALERSGASGRPWDQEPGDTVVVRCQAGSVVWVADAKGHASRFPAS